jgi:hypothetical protein
VGPAAELVAAEVEVGAGALAQAVAQARACGNPAEAEVVWAAGDWELEA